MVHQQPHRSLPAGGLNPNPFSFGAQFSGNPAFNVNYNAYYKVIRTRPFKLNAVNAAPMSLGARRTARMLTAVLNFRSRAVIN